MLERSFLSGEESVYDKTAAAKIPARVSLTPPFNDSTYEALAKQQTWMATPTYQTAREILLSVRG